MQQLHMLRPTAPIRCHALPHGYRFSAFDGSEAAIDDWLTLCKQGILPDDIGYEAFAITEIEHPDVCAERDLFFVSRIMDGARVATATAISHADGRGYIHMVDSLPEVRGKGIGHAMISHALQILWQRGNREVWLTTDDFRLAAIKVYLDAGFLPVLTDDPESDMQTRWDAILNALAYPRVPYLPAERLDLGDMLQ